MPHNKKSSDSSATKIHHVHLHPRRDWALNAEFCVRQVDIGPLAEEVMDHGLPQPLPAVLGADVDLHQMRPSLFSPVRTSLQRQSPLSTCEVSMYLVCVVRSCLAVDPHDLGW